MQRATYHPAPSPLLCPIHAKGTPGDGSAPGNSEESGHSPDPDQGEGGRASTVVSAARKSLVGNSPCVSTANTDTCFSTRTAGLRNRLLCLGENIIPGGPKTDEFTWFPGYAWQAVGCSGCSSMLGWRYFGKNGGFYGLILSALIEGEDLGR